MNFLQLCQATALESGTVAGVLNFTTVVGASGRIAQVAGWVRDAYIDIQNERQDWLWMKRDFEAQLTPGVKVYTAAELGLADVAEWLQDIPAEGLRRNTIWEDGLREQEGEIIQIEYNVWRQRYNRGVHATTKPTEWAISPQGELLFGSTPDKAYWIAGEYRQTPQVLAVNTDVPQMPEAYHRLIVGEALRLMARSDEAFQVLIEKSQQYERFRNPLVIAQTPRMSFGGGTFA